jgi:uncharacterized protein (DUF433 family)
MFKEYVTKNESGYHIADSRVSLDSIVYDYRNGLSADSIAANFRTLSLEQVYGAITYYLAHQEEVDAHLVRQREKYDCLSAQARQQHAALYRQIEAASEVAA